MGWGEEGGPGRGLGLLDGPPAWCPQISDGARGVWEATEDPGDRIRLNPLGCTEHSRGPDPVPKDSSRPHLRAGWGAPGAEPRYVAKSREGVAGPLQVS